MNIALVIIFIFLAFAVYLGIRARRGKDMHLEEWTVGGRGFGAIFIFLLLAGEIYTTFTFLGGSGWAYGEGGPAFYIIAYGCLAYVMSYWLLPAVWRYAKDNRLHSQADFFASKYESPALGVLVSLVAVVAMVPYLALQFQGLGLIVSEASYGAISATVAAIIGTVAVTVYVIISGIHGSAWTAVIKDIMVLVVVVFMGIYLPFALYGGVGEMFREIQAQKPGFLILPEEGYSPSWFVSTVLLTALGFYMWPHTFGSTFTAENARVIRRNATFLPLYQLILLFVFFVGFAAVLKVPGLSGERVDLALLAISKDTFSAPVVGLIGAAGLLNRPGPRLDAPDGVRDSARQECLQRVRALDQRADGRYHSQGPGSRRGRRLPLVLPAERPGDSPPAPPRLQPRDPALPRAALLPHAQQLRDQVGGRSRYRRRRPDRHLRDRQGDDHRRALPLPARRGR